MGNPAGTVKSLLSVAGFQALVDSVAAQVHAQYPNATLGDIVGTSPSGPTTSITDVTTWRFNDNDVNGEGRHVLIYATVFLPNRKATIIVRQNAVLYSEDLTEPVAMSPFKASLLLRLAGYREPFRTVVYARTFGRNYPHPIFIFDQGVGRDLIAVDTITQDVAPFHDRIGPLP